MSNKEKDQAESLRSLIKKIKRSDKNESTELDLPPRSQVHGQKGGKTKLKLKYPLVRLLVLMFLLLLLIVPSYALWMNNSEPVLKDSVEKNPKSENVEELDMKPEEQEVVKEEPVQKNELQEPSSSKPNDPSPIPEEQPVPVQNVEDKVKTEVQTQEPNMEFINYVVKKDDTLFSISMKFYKSRYGESIIKSTNHLPKDGTVYEGQVLKIPKMMK